MIVNHVTQLGESSRWRKYQAGIRKLELMEAPESVIQGFRRKAARDCFLAFADLMMDGNLKVSPFHELIACGFEDLAEGRYPKLIISCAPRSGKSLLSQLFVSWLIGKEDKNSHIIGSYGKQLSSKFYRGILAFCRHKEFDQIFPEFIGFEADSKYSLKAGGEILATSPGSALTGYTSGSWSMESKTVGAMVIDDPLKNSNSAAALRELEAWWAEEASTRKTNKYCQLVIATRFHVRDLHGILLDSDGHYHCTENPDGWRWLNIPALCEVELNDPLGRKVGESHWPDHPNFSPEKLLAQKRSMGDDNRFAALYQGTPTASDGALCKKEWLRYIREEDLPELDQIWLGCDTAFSEKEEADESSICVAATSKKKGDDRVYILDIIHGHWDFPDLLGIVKQVKELYHARTLAIERAASGYSLIQVLKRDTKTPIIEMKPVRSKKQRLQQVLPLFANERVVFMKGDWTHDFVKELLSFPVVPHDDRTDSMVWALTHFLQSLDSPGRGNPQEISSRIRGVSRKKAETFNRSRMFPGRKGVFKF